MGPLLARIAQTDLLLITAGKGAIPILAGLRQIIRGSRAVSAHSPGGQRGRNLGGRATLADMGQTVAENFGGTIQCGESFLGELLSREVKSAYLD